MDVVQHQILSLDFWQNTVSYEGKTFPSGTIGCDALNISPDLIEQITELCGSLNLFMGAMQLGMANQNCLSQPEKVLCELPELKGYSTLFLSGRKADGNIYPECVFR